MAAIFGSIFTLGLLFSAAVGDYATYEAFVKQQANNETFVRLFEEHLMKFQPTEGQLQADVTKFDCVSYPSPRGTPTSVHELSPADIKVVGAIGDSITAGTGISASTVLGLLWPNRGLSWSIGGDDDITKHNILPNMLKVYNPNVKGFAVKGGPRSLPDSHFNVADPGAKAEAMLGQAEMLVERMKADSSVDFQNDWKLITMFIGGNDLCDFCDDREKFSVENYINHVQTALDYLHANVPRAFVNLVEVLDISIVQRLNEGLVCQALHLFTCACAAFPADSQQEEDLLALTKQYQEATRTLAQSGRYDTRDDFTVISQPFFRDTLPPDQAGSDKPDLSYFAPDCFHLSKKGHEAAADALWNNMIEPVGQKRLTWAPGEKVECPSPETPFFYTYKNSNKQPSLGAERKQNQQPDDQSSPSSPSSNATVFVFTVVGACVLAIVVLVGVFVFRTRRRSEERAGLLMPGKYIRL